MKLTKIFTALAVTLLAANVNAGTTLVKIAEPKDAASLCAGCTSNDILIDFDGNLRGQQLYIKLESGSIMNSVAGTDTAPTDFLLGIVADVKFDSFVTIGGLSKESSQATLVVGGAVDIPEAPQGLSLGGSVASIAWAPGTGVNVPSGSDYLVARITLSPDATGQAWIFSSTSAATAGDAPLLTSRNVVNGRILNTIIPEPASMALAGFAVMGLIASRRRS